MNSFLGIGSLILSLTFLHPFDIGNLDISLCQVMVGRPCPMTFGGTSLGCYASGRPFVLVHSSLCFFSFMIPSLLFILLTLFNFLSCSGKASRTRR